MGEWRICLLPEDISNCVEPILDLDDLVDMLEDAMLEKSSLVDFSIDFGFSLFGTIAGDE